jgi:CHAT domain-containing protein
VHFATHGILDDRDPLASALALAPSSGGSDGWLRAFDMLSLTLDADVVACSACQTAVGAVVPGEGVVGMSRALLFAGARCLVLTLWPVPDLPTTELMVAFYEELRAGHPAGDALQRAKLSFRAASPENDDPFAWAAFVPVGAAWGNGGPAHA